MKKVFVSPLSITVGSKRYILNLNNYRNWYFRTSNNIKIAYKKFIREQLVKIAFQFNKAKVSYTVYRDSNRRFDLGNVCSIHEKFFEDAAVEYGVFPDDKASVIQEVHYYNGGVDRKNPRVEIEVEGEIDG